LASTDASETAKGRLADVSGCKDGRELGVLEHAQWL
jgi:hypothetical protein